MPKKKSDKKDSKIKNKSETKSKKSVKTKTGLKKPKTKIKFKEQDQTKISSKSKSRAKKQIKRKIPKTVEEIKPKVTSKADEKKIEKKLKSKAKKMLKNDALKSKPEKSQIQGVITNYRLGHFTQHEKEFLIRIPNVKNGSEASKFIGRRAIWRSDGGKKIMGKIIWIHGKNGVLRARFKKGLPGQARGTNVDII